MKPRKPKTHRDHALFPWAELESLCGAINGSVRIARTAESVGATFTARVHRAAVEQWDLELRPILAFAGEVLNPSQKGMVAARYWMAMNGRYERKNA